MTLLDWIIVATWAGITVGCLIGFWVGFYSGRRNERQRGLRARGNEYLRASLQHPPPRAPTR